MSETSDEEGLLPTDELRGTAKDPELTFLPEKSRDKYLKAYDNFNKWRLENSENTMSETVLLSYFMHLSHTKQPPTMWSIYSMLKATIKTKDDVHIEDYKELVTFLKGMSVGHNPKKSKIFTPSDIDKFINEAPDIIYLGAKVILILGINGGCRTNELLNLTVDGIEKHSETLLLIKLPKTSNNRSFVVREEYVQIVEQYKSLRPPNTKTDRFFLQYHKGKCSRQPMGVNKIGGIPRDIATYLKLPDPQLYTGHCFKRTSATLLADSGADLTLLKRQGDTHPGTSRETNVERQSMSKIWVCIDPPKT
ncbi:uncharacterized protein LOC133515846 [Cydia pomonella]|uniref:uncharacterized protein LOC133515846 n=1 Tax=Cydia pomonella TaxID=82600 RepID=UPI002ADD37FD|nr:uncharacterized protein LOC133515846 [Cydia pomonella]XP_061704421.1 uncharacterized protein LOC133515846 [Cydia pomonella]XP_061704422.1 uncharacterized protein LOC133515846 [Cydia pomonella]